MPSRGPARLDALLTLRSRVTRLGRASIHFAQRAEREG
nr:hotdog domain-containing protein [Bordetella holmesii]